MFKYIEAQAFSTFVGAVEDHARHVGDGELAALAEEARLFVNNGAPFVATSHAVARLVGELHSREWRAEEESSRDETFYYVQTSGIERYWMPAWRFSCHLRQER